MTDPNNSARVLTKTRTGCIISDLDMQLEYLFVGDYGKENNIKADFLGYTHRIEKVEHSKVDLSNKLVVTISSQKGCLMSCGFCDCPRYGFYGNANKVEMMSEITTAIALSGIKTGKRLNLHFARMGEPTFNHDVIDVAKTAYHLFRQDFEEYHPVVSTMMPRSNSKLRAFLKDWILAGYEYGGEDGFGLQFSINTLNEEKRNLMFQGKSLSLDEIGRIINILPAPKQRKFTLNFAVTSESDLDPDLMDKYFDKERCVIKITPIHETKAAINNNYDIIKNYDPVYEKFEKPLVAAGWNVIVFIPSNEEDEDRITCGNSLLAIEGDC